MADAARHEGVARQADENRRVFHDAFDALEIRGAGSAFENMEGRVARAPYREDGVLAAFDLQEWVGRHEAAVPKRFDPADVGLDARGLALFEEPEFPQLLEHGPCSDDGRVNGTPREKWFQAWRLRRSLERSHGGWARVWV